MASTEEQPPPEKDKTTRRPRKARGVVVTLPNRCKGCGFCVEFCPTEALAMSEEMNEKGYHFPKVVYADRCNGCDLCGMLCPDFALYGFVDKSGRKGGS
jgi:2-oxoglutarate ferredoxin oxidoreductase subunit delta